MRSLRRFFVAATLTLASASVAQAQYLTDAGSPLGSGAGTTAALGIANAAYTNALNTYVAAIMGGAQVPNPAGGSVSISEDDAAAVDRGFAGYGDLGVLAQALGGGSAGTALATALQAFGDRPTAGALQTLVTAYNAAIDAVPAGSQPTGALLLVRQSLSVAGVPNWAR